MSWKECLVEVLKKEVEPMRQITHWTLFISAGLVYVFKTVEGAAAASYGLILQNPEIASTSWLSNTIFY